MSVFMHVVISMLRGVNVGAHNRMKMDEIRAVYESLGLRDPRTYVQSGNVVFQTGEQNLVRLSGRIQDGIEKHFHFRPEVILRTAAEMREVIARNPFAKRHAIDPAKLLVTFLAGEPAPEARDRFLEIETEPDELRLDGRELYIYFPNGMGRSKLSPGAIEKVLKIPGTGRNWNSVTTLLEIAEAFRRGRPAYALMIGLWTKPTTSFAAVSKEGNVCEFFRA